jgi:surfactin synthase thioesterase subunit
MKAILLHHAGGDKYAFRNVQQWLQPELNAVALEIPGRGDRFADPLITSIEGMADDLYPKLLAELNEDYIFIGMSMGALLSFLLTHRLAQHGERLPEHMFLVSRMPFANYEAGIDFAALDSAAFWDYIISYDARSRPIAEHAELRGFYEPILRADFTAMQTYHHSFDGLPKLPVPASVYYGKEDNKVIDANRIQEWSRQFENVPEYEVFEGGHFFFYESQQPVEQIKSKIIR